MSNRSWRKEPVTYSAGTSWRLVAGSPARGDRPDTRVRINLGPVTEDQATAALARMQAHEDREAAGPIVDLYQQDKRGESDARAYLLGDPGKAELLPAPTVDYASMRLRDYQPRYAEWRQKANPGAWKSERSHWRRILGGPLGDRRLREIVEDSRHVFEWLSELRVEPSGGVRRGTARAADAFVPDGAKTKPASGAYRRLLRSALQALLTRAWQSKDLPAKMKVNLADGLDLKGSTTRARPKAQALTKEEFAALLVASEGKARAMWGAAVGLGVRPSELTRMRWEDIAWSKGQLGTVAVRGSKTDASTAEVSMTGTARRELAIWWKACGEPATGIVFPADVNRKDEDGKRIVGPYAPAGYKRTLATAARRAGIDRPVTPYCLRHSFATLALAEGISEDLVRATLRHTDPSMVRKVYDGRTAAQHGPEAARFDVG